MVAYKIRNADGLFAKAAFHYWTKNGKTWSMLAKHTAAEALGEAEDEEMLTRLVKMRDYLWT